MKNSNRTPVKVLSFLACFLVVQLLLSSCSQNNGLITASGIIETVEVKVSSKASGEVIGLYVDEGNTIEKGQSLALIDHALLDLQLEQAKAGVDLAEAQLALLLQGAREEDIQQAEESLKQAEENFKIAREDYQRMSELFEGGSVTKKERDNAQARFVVTQAQWNSASQALKKLQNLARPEEIKADRARLHQARISTQILEKNIADCTVVSPLSGVVTYKLVEQGELVRYGTPLLVISDLETVTLKIYVSEKELGKVRIGQEAQIRIDTFPSRSFSGRVVYISQEAEFTPKNIQTREERTKLVFAVKIERPNPDGVLKPGLPADATLSEAENRGAGAGS